MSVLQTTFQDAKDSFYLALRDRLAAVNPDRTTVVRGAQRPAVLVAENEQERGGGSGLQGASGDVRDAFVLHWGSVAADTSEAMPLEHATCEIRFATAGSAELAGMDRGRALAAMRGELGSMLLPAQAMKTSYAGEAPVAALTPVFWSDVTEEKRIETAGRVQCAVTVVVFAWKEGL